MAGELKLSIVMATYNRAETLKVTLRHLVEQDFDPADFELIIVDDASPDNTTEVVEKAIGEVPFSLRYMRHEENRGPGYTENRGIREARAPLILLMADDIWMVPGALRRHLRFHEANPEPGKALMGCVLQSPELNQSVFLRHWDPFRFKSVQDGEELPYYHFWANNISVKREFLTEHGLFREDMGRGGAAAHEDSELGYRLHKAGLRIYYDSAALGHHYHFVTLEGAINRWYQRGYNWGELYELVPEPEIPVFYHVLNFRTLGDHIRATLSQRRKYLRGPNRNLPVLLLHHLARLVVFNGLTARCFWRPLLDRAETTPALTKLVNSHVYRLFLFYHFLRGVRDAEVAHGQ